MKHWATVFGGIVMLSFACANLPAQSYQFGGPDNYYNADGSYLQIPEDNPGTYYSTLPYGPTATEDGLVWLNTGGGPALQSGNLAVSVYYENTSSAWQLEETEIVGDGGYAGYFVAKSIPIWGQARSLSNPLIVSTETIPVSGLPGQPEKTFQQGLFYLQAWTDPALESAGKSAYSTYAQAFAASESGAAGVYVAQTVPFKVDFGSGLLLDANEMGMYMPAVVMTAAASPGDANGDGKVDINDLTIVLSHFGQTGMTWSQGEFTGDGTVDINDLTIVLSNFGKSSRSSAGDMAGVPEPGTLALLAAGLVGLLASAKARHTRATNHVYLSQSAQRRAHC